MADTPSRSEIAARMKDFENQHRHQLKPRSYTIIRIDGRAFHTYTQDLERPCDSQFMADMDATAVALLKEIGGARFAYVQSDEISILLTDFENEGTTAWFGGVAAKLVSISASIATAAFNSRRPGKTALFDSRAFTLPSSEEVRDYFASRQWDASRNSIQALGQTLFTRRELHGKTCREILEDARHVSGVRWDDLPDGFRFGRLVAPSKHAESVTYTDKRTGVEETVLAVRSRWSSDPAPRFDDATGANQLRELIPQKPTPGRE